MPVKLFLLFLIGIILFGFAADYQKRHPAVPADAQIVRYVAVGDSYTYGQGAGQGQDWPTLLTRDLQNHQVRIELVRNLGKNGWTSQQVIDYQLPEFKQLQPTFATLLIGVNDWVQGVSHKDFQTRFSYLLTQMIQTLPNKDRIIVLTIPNYSATPVGVGLGLRGGNSAGISEFNAIIVEEAAKQGVRVVDLYPLSQAMRTNPELVSPDGLHPSAQEYALWEKEIFPIAYQLVGPVAGQ